MVDFWASIAAAFIVCLNFTAHYLFSEQPETIASSTETSFFGVDMRASVIIKFLFKSTLLQDTNNFKPHTQKKNMFVNCKTKKNTKLPFWEDASSAKTQGKCKRAWLFFCRIIILHYSTCILSTLFLPQNHPRAIFWSTYFHENIAKISSVFSQMQKNRVNFLK